MSWVHFAKRWKIIWPERLDSREVKIGSVLEVTTSNFQGKVGMDIRIESVNKDNSHSWVRISHDFNKLVTDLSQQRDRRQVAGNLYNEDASICDCKPIQGWSKTKKTLNNLFIFDEFTHSWKKMDLHSTTSSIWSSLLVARKKKHFFDMKNYI